MIDHTRTIRFEIVGFDQETLTVLDAKISELIDPKRQNHKSKYGSEWMMKSLLRFRLATLLMIVGLSAVCCAWYVNQVSGQPAQKIMHVGGSLAMSPTITREYLVVDVNAYRHSKPERWHAIVMNPKERRDGSTVAEVLRVVGLPGETVTFSDGNVIIDGQVLIPPQRLQKIRFHVNLPEVESDKRPYTIPDGHYYLLGDNPDEAKDSRLLGAFPEAEIRGRVSSR